MRSGFSIRFDSIRFGIGSIRFVAGSISPKVVAFQSYYLFVLISFSFSFRFIPILSDSFRFVPVSFSFLFVVLRKRFVLRSTSGEEMSLRFPSFAKNDWIAFGNDLMVRSEYDSVRLLIAFISESKGDIRFVQWLDSIVAMIANEDDSAFDSALQRGMNILWHSSFSSEKMNARVNVVRSRVRTENAPKHKDFRSLPNGKIVAGFREAKKNSVSSGSYGDYGISTNGKCSIDSPRFKDSRVDSIAVQNAALKKERSFANNNRPNNVLPAKIIRGDAFDQTPRKVAESKKKSTVRSVERSSFDILSDIVRENRIK